MSDTRVNIVRKPLSSGHKHMLGLIRTGAKDDGWAPVSKAVATLFTNEKIPSGVVPRELCEYEPNADSDGGRARLTDEGNSVLDAMAWL